MQRARPRCGLSPPVHHARPTARRLGRRDPLAEHGADQLLPDHTAGGHAQPGVATVALGDERMAVGIEAGRVVVQADPSGSPFDQPRRARTPRLGRHRAAPVPLQPHRARTVGGEHGLGERVRSPAVCRVAPARTERPDGGGDVDVAGRQRAAIAGDTKDTHAPTLTRRHSRADPHARTRTPGSNAEPQTPRRVRHSRGYAAVISAGVMRSVESGGWSATARASA